MRLKSQKHLVRYLIQPKNAVIPAKAEFQTSRTTAAKKQIFKNRPFAAQFGTDSYCYFEYFRVCLACAFRHQTLIPIILILDGLGLEGVQICGASFKRMRKKPKSLQILQHCHSRRTSFNRSWREVFRDDLKTTVVYQALFCTFKCKKLIALNINFYQVDR